MGICGEHGGEPSSVAFFAKAGLDYVSCSPFRLEALLYLDEYIAGMRHSQIEPFRINTSCRNRMVCSMVLTSNKMVQMWHEFEFPSL